VKDYQESYDAPYNFSLPSSRSAYDGLNIANLFFKFKGWTHMLITSEATFFST